VHRPDAAEIVRSLALQPHPEGGFFRELYRAETHVDTPRGPRPASTAIYFLLTADTFSALHRIASDEAWHFYAGDPLDVICLEDATGARRDLRLGPDFAAGAAPFALVPARTWFGARVAQGGAWSLCGCTVAPGFDFADFEMGQRAALTARFAAHAAIIAELTRVP
jgi:predicted cupin superfamily sugar epimerase